MDSLGVTRRKWSAPLRTMRHDEKGDEPPPALATGAIPIATALPFATSTRRPYKGFSTSICDLFHGSHALHKEDCCAFACCGILAHDKARYLLLSNQQQNIEQQGLDDDERSVHGSGELLSVKTLSKSSLLHFVIQFFVVPCLMIFAMVTAGDRIANVEKNDLVTSWILVALIIYLIVISIKYQCDRVRFRRHVAEISIASSPLAPPQYGSLNPYRGRTPSDEQQGCCAAYCAHKVVGIYPRDNYNAQGLNLPSKPDCCSNTMQVFSDMCCGVCCGCWLQCFGCCATAQEAREVRLLINDDSKCQIDHVTFQPYQAYNTKLERLRSERVDSMAQHYSNVSKLSKLLLKALTFAIVCLLLAGLFDLAGGGGFQLWNLAIVVATFSQAFFVLYFVHWRWNRFDLSMDAIVKYFAAGFLLTTGLAMFFEMIESLVIQFIMYILVLILEGDTIAAQIENEAQGGNPDDQPSIMDTFAADYPFIVLVFLACNAFLVAAVVEELCKYFGYWMVEHPDFLLGSNRSKQSLGAGITVAMVAVAMGFACCENLIYIFVYTGGGVQMEFATLFMRSLFPVHPLCAAIQSIGVCQRDLEKTPSVGIGKLLLPAVFLHGTFDFSLMVLGYLNPVGEEDENNEEMSAAALMLTIVSFAISLVLVLMGFCYYFAQAKAQRARLALLDSNLPLASDHLTTSSTRLVI